MTLRESPQCYLPNLYTFQNGNTFLGSFRGLRFRVKPGEAGEGEEKTQTLEALVWYGPLCLELSRPEAEAAFPRSEEGYAALLDWLDAEYVRFQAENQL